ncbi:FG-GAP repeat domain-containing protein [Acidobacteriota bacterium]
MKYGRIRSSSIAFLCLFLLLADISLAGMPFPTTPDWVSTDVTSVSTGGALVDLNRDGWLDLVVSNGNDIARQPLAVYYNRGDGTFPDRPDWLSENRDYHGYLTAGDVNDDGWPDVAVSVYLGRNGFSAPGWAALYLNDGTGRLSSTPDWESTDHFYTFAVAFGDADSDGDLDLAVAVGEPYHNPAGRNHVFFNNNGALESTPGWSSEEIEHNMGVTWGDQDDDGDLDLAFSGSGAPHRIYYQTPAGLETASSWQSNAAAPIGVKLSLADIDRDGHTDLAVSENSQLGGEGHFRIYKGSAMGLPSAHSWSSQFSGYGSETVVGDANGDGWPDLLTGGWGTGGVYSDQIRIFPNRYIRPIDEEPQWTSSTGSVIERLMLGDVNNDGLMLAEESWSGDGQRKVFTLERFPFREIIRITADGEHLGINQYCYDRESAWVSLASAPSETLTIEYIYSVRPDLAVTNWDGDVGNYLFYAGTPPLLFAERGPTGTELSLDWDGGRLPFDTLEAISPDFGPGLSLVGEALDINEWIAPPGTLPIGVLTYYRVY